MDQFLEELLLKKALPLHLQICEQIGALVDDVRLELSAPDKVHIVRVNRIQATVTRIQLLVQEFEPDPKLLDKHLSHYITTLSNLYLETTQSSLCFNIEDIIYTLSKIRGFKNITNYFSSEVYLFPQLLKLKESPSLFDNEKFLILLWLSNLVLVPFELQRIEAGLPERLFEVALESLNRYSNGSKIQIVSLILMSRLVTRPDQHHLLDKYFNTVVVPVWSRGAPSDVEKLSHLITINKIMKRTSHLAKYSMTIGDLLSQDFEILAAEDGTRYFTNMNILYIIKLSDRLCSNYFMENLNYDMVAKSVNNLFQKVLLAPKLQNKFDVSLRYAFARALSNICALLDKHAVNYQDQLVQYVLEEFEIPNLQILQELHFQPDLFIKQDYINISKYHTLLLTVGFFLLRKCLPVQFIPALLSIVHQTLFFSQRRLTVTVGASIRDSSCFILWAISKSVQQETISQILDKPTRDTILADILKVCIFDEDLVIRRCGIAVLQEFIGRFGNEIFELQEMDEKGKFIIEFIQLFDAHSIGSSTNSYSLILSLVEMGFDQDLFIPILISNLCDPYKSFKLKKLNATIMVDLHRAPFDTRSTVLNLSFFRHGEKSSAFSLDTIAKELTNLALAGEVGPLYALSKLIPLMGGHDLNFISELSKWLENVHLDSSERGEEFMSFMSTLGQLQNHPLLESLNLKVYEVLKLSNTDGLVRQLQNYFAQTSSDFNGFDKIIALIRSNNLNSAETIGHFKYLPQLTLEKVVDVVKERQMVLVETRALVQQSLSYYYHKQGNEALIDLDSISQLLDDYTTTTQGDVGSKLRSCTILLLEVNLALFPAQYIEDEILPRIIRISCESLGKLRNQAFALLSKIENHSEIDEELDIKAYYRMILQKYRSTVREDYKIAFWSGYVFSTGGASNRSTINASVDAVMMYLQDNISELLEILTILLNLLIQPAKGLKSADPRLIKRYLATLNLIAVLLESNSFQLLDTDIMERIYIRSYNLHINTANIERVLQVIKIFEALAISEHPVSAKARKRLCWLAGNHQVPIVRLGAGTSLYEIATEIKNSDLCSVLEEMRWEKSKLNMEQVCKML